MSRPNEIIEDIRSVVFPNKRVALQQALAGADTEGDGFIKKELFIKAFQVANVSIDLNVLEFLFDVMAETYSIPPTDFEPNQRGADESPERVMSLKLFMERVFNQHEMREVDEVELTLSNVKAALVYKGIDFSIVFAEQSEETTQKKFKQQTKKSKEEKKRQEEEKKEAKKRKQQSVDMTMQYTRFAQQIVKDEFCRRVMSLNAPHVT